MAASLDLDRLTEMTDGDSQLERELATLYLSTAQRYVETMGQAIDGEDGWRDPAHSLKGASANMGAAKMAELAREAEDALPREDLLHALAHELTSVRTAFESRLGSIDPVPN